MSDQTDFCRDSSKITLTGDFQPSNQSDQLAFSVSFSGAQHPRYPPAGISQKKSPPEARCPNLAKIFIPKWHPLLFDVTCWAAWLLCDGRVGPF